jgi:cell division transport system permease protein
MLERGVELAFDEDLANGDPANRYLPWIVALMVYLATLAVAGALVLGASAARWQSGQSDRLTIQVPPQIPPKQEAAADHWMAPVMDILRATPGIAAVRRLEREELAGLLEPWLGVGNVTAELPLPELIDVTVERGAKPDLEALKRRLEKVAPGVEIDDHGRWMNQLSAAARAAQALALALTVMIAGAATATVVVATRASLAVHRETIELLHLIGAQDGAVAHAFARRALGLGLRGGLIGLALAALTYLFLQQATAGLDAPLMPRLDLSLANLAVLAALPLASAAIAMVTARFTVLKALAKLP